MELIEIKGDYIKLEALLKYAALTGSGGEAKYVIGEGMVKVNSETCIERGKKIRKDDIVEFAGNTIKVISDGN